MKFNFKEFKGRTILFVASIVLMVIAGVILSFYFNNRLSGFNKLNYEVSSYYNSFEKLRINVKDFINKAPTDEAFFDNGQNSYSLACDSIFYQLENKMKVISSSGIIDNRQKELLINMNVDIGNYKLKFDSIKVLIHKKGFKDKGLEGLMREDIHYIENSSFDVDKVNMLLLRRHEKDFLLRSDLKYKDKFGSVFDEFRTNMLANNAQFSEDTIALLTQKMENYKNGFYELIRINEQLGLTEGTGLKGRLNEININLASSIELFNEQMVARISRLENTTNLILISINAIVVITLVFFIRFLIKNAFDIIDQITHVSQVLSKGNLNVDIGIFKRNNLLGGLGDAIENLVNKLKNLLNFLENISEQKLDMEVDVSDSSDVLNATIHKIQHKFISVREEDQKRSWTNQGLNEFADILRSYNDLEVLSDALISHLVKYLKMNQGALFVVMKNDSGDAVLELMGCYAYNRKKFKHAEINPGDGLVGQAYLEKEPILLKEIPDDYVDITSGLGQVTPGFIAIIPLVSNGVVEGVIEMAGFDMLKDFELDFMNKLSESIASSLAMLRISESTEELLEDARKKNEELLQRDEEMRQNMEELQATQEAAERKEQDYLTQIAELQASLDELNKNQ